MLLNHVQFGLLQIGRRTYIEMPMVASLCFTIKCLDVVPVWYAAPVAK